MSYASLDSQLNPQGPIFDLISGTDISEYLRPHAYKFPIFNHNLFFQTGEGHQDIASYIPSGTPQRISLCIPDNFRDQEYQQEIAVIGLRIFDLDTLAITQIQGVHRDLVGFPIQDYMPHDLGDVAVDIILDVAHDYRFKTVGIRSAEKDPCYNNPWDLSEEEVPNLQKRMRRRYDEVALKKGFDLNDDGFFVKEIN